MRVVDRDGIVVVHDSPGLHWILGVLFLIVGVVCIAGPLGLFHDRDRLGWPGRSLFMLMGAVGAVTGLWILRGAPRSTLEIDRLRGRVRLRRRGLRSRRTWTWGIHGIAGIRVVESKDSDGDAVFRLEIVAEEGAAVPVSLLWTHGREPAEATATRLQEALGLPRRLTTRNEG
jgi:hypothetical protein